MTRSLDLFSDGTKSQRYLGLVPISSLAKSPHNPRRTYDEARVAELAKHIAANGYDVTRAVKVHRGLGGELLVFAGSTRLRACGEAGVRDVPAFEFIGYSAAEIWRLAYEDNASDGKHTTLSIVDVWADYAERYAGGMKQQAIADALGVSQPLVSRRIKWHKLTAGTKRAVCDGTLDEGHLEAADGVTCDVAYFAPWLTTEAAQAELLAEVLGKHRGSTAGIKPTVKVVREAAARWKAMITAAVEAHEALAGDGGRWQAALVAALVAAGARTEAAVNAAKVTVLKAQQTEAEERRRAAQEAASAAEREAEIAEREAEARAHAVEVCERIMLGDARERLGSCPPGARLLLADPPYGQEYQSQRRKTTAKKGAIANDDLGSALALLLDVLRLAVPRMAEDSTVMLFTSWRFEPEFRAIVTDAGLTIKGSLVWVKRNHGTGDLAGSFAPRHERIIHAVKGSPKLYSRPDDVLFGDDKQDSDHPTEKPQDILRQIIEATTASGDMVLDPFAGSGATLFAAWDTERKFWGCEIDEGWHRKITDELYRRAVEAAR